MTPPPRGAPRGALTRRSRRRLKRGLIERDAQSAWLGVELEPAGDTFPDQVEAVLAFLRRERPELERLCAFPGLDECVLDFAVDFVEEAFMLSLPLPADLVRAAGQLGIALEITLFRTNEAGEWLVPGAP